MTDGIFVKEGDHNGINFNSNFDWLVNSKIKYLGPIEEAIWDPY